MATIGSNRYYHGPKGRGSIAAVGCVGPSGPAAIQAHWPSAAAEWLQVAWAVTGPKGPVGLQLRCYAKQNGLLGPVGPAGP